MKLADAFLDSKWVRSGLLFGVPFVLFAPVLLTGQALYWGTPALQFIPWMEAAWQSLSQGVFPWWNPLNGMGAPLAANYQAGLFYPLNWLLLAARGLGGTPWMAWFYTLLVVFHLGWAGLGMARLMEQLGGKALAQLIAGLSFGLSGYLVARVGFFSMTWAAAWIPWVIWAVTVEIGSPLDDLPRGRSWLPLRFSACLGLQLLCGHAQLSWYTILLAGIWATVSGWRQSGLRGIGRNGLRLAAGGLLAAALAVVQLLPTAEYLLQSQRASQVDASVAMTYSFWPWRVLALAAPEFFGNPGRGDYWGYANYWEDAVYVGLLPLLLALSTLPVWRRGGMSKFSAGQRILARWIWAVIAVAFLLALGNRTPVFPFLFAYVPTFAMFQAPARWMIWLEFGLALLAGLGVSVWVRPVGRARRRLKRLVTAAAAVTLGALGAWFLLREVDASFIRATALAGLLGVAAGVLSLNKPLAEDRPSAWRWLAVGLVAVDLLTAGWLLNPAIDRDFYRAEMVDHSVVKAALGADGRLYLSPGDEYVLKFRRFLRFKDFRPIEDRLNQRTVLIPDLNLLEGIASVNNFDPLVMARYDRWMKQLALLPAQAQTPWLAAMNVRVVETIDLSLPIGVKFNPLKDSGGRFRWAGCARAASDETEAWQSVLTRMKAEPTVLSPVVLEKTADAGCVEADGGTLIQLLEDRPDGTLLQVTTRQAGWLVQADSWYPGWRVWVDGREAPLLIADTVFRAVAVPPGEHVVEIAYRPRWLTPVWVVAAAAWLFLILEWRRKRPLMIQDQEA